MLYDCPEVVLSVIMLSLAIVIFDTCAVAAGCASVTGAFDWLPLQEQSMLHTVSADNRILMRGDMVRYLK
jgi:hypothetical protein